MSKILRFGLGAAALLVPGLVLAQTSDFTTTSAASSAAASGFAGLFFMFAFVLWIIGFALWILWLFMLVDLAHRDFPNPGDKTAWALVLGILSVLGGIIYYFFGRTKGTRSDHPAMPATPPAPTSPVAPSAPAAPDA